MHRNQLCVSLLAGATVRGGRAAQRTTEEDWVKRATAASNPAMQGPGKVGAPSKALLVLVQEKRLEAAFTK